MKIFKVIILLLIITIPEIAKLKSPTITGLSISGDNILHAYYRSENMMVRYDFWGSIISQIKLEGKRTLNWWPGFIYIKGMYLGRNYSNSSKNEKTTFIMVQPDGKIYKHIDITGKWYQIRSNDYKFYIYEKDEHAINIKSLDLNTGKMKNYSCIKLKPFLMKNPFGPFRFYNLVIDSRGDIIVLFRLVNGESKGFFVKITKTGKIKFTRTIRNDEKAVFGLLNGIYLDMHDNIIITYSPEESYPKQGGIYKFSREGVLSMIIKEDVSYVRSIAISKTGTIFLYQLDGKIHRYNSNGKKTFEWNVLGKNKEPKIN